MTIPNDEIDAGPVLVTTTMVGAFEASVVGLGSCATRCDPWGQNCICASWWPPSAELVAMLLLLGFGLGIAVGIWRGWRLIPMLIMSAFGIVWAPYWLIFAYFAGPPKFN